MKWFADWFKPVVLNLWYADDGRHGNVVSDRPTLTLCAIRRITENNIDRIFPNIMLNPIYWRKLPYELLGDLKLCTRARQPKHKFLRPILS